MPGRAAPCLLLLASITVAQDAPAAGANGSAMGAPTVWRLALQSMH
jgi:hypothetical protein